MKRRTLSLLAVGLCGFAAHGSLVQAQAVRVEGASAGFSISQAAAAEFRRGHAGAVVTIGISGSGGALAKLCRGAIDLVHSARPILAAEIGACGKAEAPFIELPLAFDAVTVVVNRKNSFVQRLTLAELRTMWEETARARIVRWSQVNPQFSDAPIKLLAPDPQFESSSYFAAAILGPGKAVRRDHMTSVDDNVLIQGVARDLNALSYVSVASFLENRAKLRAVPIAASAGAEAVAPSPETIARGEYQPLSRPIFLYISTKSLARPEVAAFAEFYTANAERFAKGANYVPLTEGTYRAGQERLRRRVAGSVWNGTVVVGLSMQELQKREAL